MEPMFRKKDQEDANAITPRGTKGDEMVEEAIRERIIEREIVRRRIGLGTDDNDVLRVLRYTQFAVSRRERGYETHLSQVLSTKGYAIEPERSGKSGGFNVVLGENDIAVEVKIVKDINVLNSFHTTYDEESGVPPGFLSDI